MRLIPEIYKQKDKTKQPVVSIELFPPKTSNAQKSLYERALPRLAKAKPDFFSVTYGAGGATRDKTLEVADRIQKTHGITSMAHLTCISSTQEEIIQYLADAKALDIQNILALRGDPPRDQPDASPADNGLDYAFQLIDFIKAHGEFSIGAAGFPEGHISCNDGKHVDWKRVKNKLDHGAEFILTQLFFTNSDYFEFLEYMAGTLRVSKPITPGVLPILSTDQIKRFTKICGAALPKELLNTLERFENNAEAMRDFGVDFATRQCETLLAGGAPGIHLYSLNRSHACVKILDNLGLIPEE